MSGVAQLGLLARSLARQPGLRISRRLMGIVAAPLTVKVDARVAGVVIVRGLLLRLILGLEALVPGPRLDQRAVDREVLIAEQPLVAGLFDHRREKTFRHLALEQALPVLSKSRCVPHLIVDAKPHEPTEQEVVVELLHQKPLAAYRIKELQQKRSQQLLGRDRRTAVA